MLKTRVANETWLVHQPDHARVSGYLAAHWGNHEFARPGYFAPSNSAEVYREHVVHAIAEHDNGWWEWEASPEFDEADRLPLNLTDVSRTSADAGFQRWRLGIPRLRNEDPYASLLISLHSYWLYAFAISDLPDLDDAMRHPLFGQSDMANRPGDSSEPTRQFLREQREIQDTLIDELRKDELFVPAVTPGHLSPHVRLLQVLDAMSLLISFGGQQAVTLNDIPRRSWDDRVTLTWTPDSNRSIICTPYPFVTDPLDVYLPVRVDSGHSRENKQSPLVHLHATPLRTILFRLRS